MAEAARQSKRNKTGKTPVPLLRNSAGGQHQQGIRAAAEPSLSAFYGAGPVVELAAPAVQTKLSIGKAGDPYEREADAVADKVMGGGTVTAITPVTSANLNPVSRMASTEAPESAGEESPNMETMQRTEEETQEEPAVQTQLLQREEQESEEPEAQAMGLQRQAESEEENAEAGPTQSIVEAPREEAVRQAQSVQRERQEGEEPATQALFLQRQDADKMDADEEKSMQRMADEQKDAGEMQTRAPHRQAQTDEEPEAQSMPLQHQAGEEDSDAAGHMQRVNEETTEETGAQTQSLQRTEQKSEDAGLQTKGLSWRDSESGEETPNAMPERKLAVTHSRGTDVRNKDDKEPGQPAPQGKMLQTACACGGEKQEETQRGVQKLAVSGRQTTEKNSGKRRKRGTGGEANMRQLTRALRQTSGGNTLATSIRQMMERGTGWDFGNVRVHSDHDAQEANHVIKARAFTQGYHIWLGRGETQNNTQLMAHELTHVVQQNSAPGATLPIQRKFPDTPPKRNEDNPFAESKGDLNADNEGTDHDPASGIVESTSDAPGTAARDAFFAAKERLPDSSFRAYPPLISDMPLHEPATPTSTFTDAPTVSLSAPKGASGQAAEPVVSEKLVAANEVPETAAEPEAAPGQGASAGADTTNEDSIIINMLINNKLLFQIFIINYKHF